MRVLARALVSLALAAAASAVEAQQQQQPKPNQISGQTAGVTTLTITILNQNGKVVTAAVPVTVVPRPLATLSLYNALNPARWIDTITVGQSFCILAVGRDSAGNVLPGLPVTFTSSNPAVATITTSPACPNVTIDPTTFVLPDALQLKTPVTPAPIKPPSEDITAGLIRTALREQLAGEDISWSRLASVVTVPPSPRP